MKEVYKRDPEELNQLSLGTELAGIIMDMTITVEHLAATINTVIRQAGCIHNDNYLVPAFNKTKDEAAAVVTPPRPIRTAPIATQLMKLCGLISILKYSTAKAKVS